MTSLYSCLQRIFLPTSRLEPTKYELPSLQIICQRSRPHDYLGQSKEYVISLYCSINRRHTPLVPRLTFKYLRIPRFATVLMGTIMILPCPCGTMTLNSRLVLLRCLLYPPFAKAWDIKTHSSVCLPFSPPVTNTLTFLISSEVLMIDHWYLAFMIIVTCPFNDTMPWPWPLTYFKVKYVAGRGPHI